MRFSSYGAKDPGHTFWLMAVWLVTKHLKQLFLSSLITSASSGDGG